MSEVPPRLDAQLRAARHEAERRQSRWEYLPGFLVAFAIFPVVRPWLTREFHLSSRASYVAAIFLRAIVGFIVQAGVTRIRRQRATAQRVDRDKAV